ncbi:protein CAJ1 isoform X1 [Syzygium oleosum]|uniref:protein CAJ1 isoform X1 n=1 Tax=Syzygium oleosum TaxID=219896 RepID=UPI0011D29CC8|nr:protein CAJ1 isoform X1 [Syzygium oleosum]
MRSDEARVLLGFPPNSRPTPSQVKAAFKKKVWESHPDLFPVNEKPTAESKFKRISEACNCMLSGAKWEYSESGSYVRVVRRGVSSANGAKGHRVLVGIPFLLIVLGTVGLGGLNASRAYNREKENYPSHNPFLP